MDDGVTTHKDMHDGMGEFPAARNPATHPEWWGKTFFKHFPNHGFVGDLFTVNGTAYPVMEVERRKYRFRFLDCSVSRIYDFKLMSSTQGHKAAKDLGYIGDELQGQYRIPDGEQCMQFTEIATDGGLLPMPITRDNFELWPAKRREVIIDFTKYQDGTSDHHGRRGLPHQRVEDARWSHVEQLHPLLAGPELQDPDDQVRHWSTPGGEVQRPGDAGQERHPEVDDAGAAAGSFELEGPHEQPVGVRTATRQRRR